MELVSSGRILGNRLSFLLCYDVKMILSPKCLCPAAKLLVQWKTYENVLECFGQSSSSRLEMISLNYLPWR